MFQHFSIDIETLSARADAAILTVGVTPFNMDGEVGESFLARVDWQSNLDTGRHIDPETLRWWMRQSDAAREEIVKPGEHLTVVLSKTVDFLRTHGDERGYSVWGNGSSFDVTILEDAFKKEEPFVIPWAYNAPRDLRTLVAAAEALADFDKKSAPFEGTAHRADHDSRHQARIIQAAYAALADNMKETP